MSTEIYTRNQRIRVQPTEVLDGITVEFRESRDEFDARYLYLNKDEMKDMIKVMQQMMDHVEPSIR